MVRRLNSQDLGGLFGCSDSLRVVSLVDQSIVWSSSEVLRMVGWSVTWAVDGLVGWLMASLFCRSVGHLGVWSVCETVDH